MSADSRSYAQTILQLYNQLQACGYSPVEMALVRNSYDVAMRRFAGRFQPSGKTFIAHVVGTASILASISAPAEVVAAGLLHNIYVNGDFGHGTSGFSKAKQRALRRVIGRAVERYVAAFVKLRWRLKDIAGICDESIELGSLEREVLLIKLADELEHLLDLDVLYYNPAISKGFVERAAICVAAAKKLDVPALAANLASALQLIAASDQPPALCCHAKRNFSFVVLPRSHRRIFLQPFCRRKIQKLYRLSLAVIRRLRASSRD
jgi:(p)ppGpp synthase/HD superfamily hydrolase